MKGLYVYCVLPANYPPPASLNGLDSVSVSELRAADLTCWVSQLDARPEPALERIRAHNQVVQTAIESGVTPVPVRFGQWLPSPAKLEEHLLERSAHYHALLALVQGALEFGLRIIDPEHIHEQASAPEAVGSGRAYLEALRRQLHAHDLDDPRVAEVRTALQEVFREVARAERFEPLRTTHGLISVAHLVRQPEFSAYHQRVLQFRQRFPRLRVLSSGPWPPYSFAA